MNSCRDRLYSYISGHVPAPFSFNVAWQIIVLSGLSACYFYFRKLSNISSHLSGDFGGESTTYCSIFLFEIHISYPLFNHFKICFYGAVSTCIIYVSRFSISDVKRYGAGKEVARSRVATKMVSEG